MRADKNQVASEEIVEIARNEALQYVLEDVDGTAQPIITGAFFGDWKNLFSNQTLNNLMETGGFILENQLMDYQNALVEWDNYYGLNNEQFFLIDDLYKKKVSHGNDAIILDEREKRYIYIYCNRVGQAMAFECMDEVTG